MVTKLRRIGVMAFLMIAVTAMLPSMAAQAGTSTNLSSCVKMRDADTYATYLSGQLTTSTKKSGRDIKVSTTSIAKSFDCGPAGRAFSVPSVTVTTEWRISGTDLICNIEVGGGTGGATGAIKCNSSRTEATVSDSYTCRNKSSCTASYTPAVFSASANGSITEIWVKAVVTASGVGGLAKTSATQTAY